MALFNKQELQSEIRKSFDVIVEATSYQSTKSFLGNKMFSETKNIKSNQEFDIFLSHSFQDADIIYQLKKELENYGLTVYVDWVEDGQLDRSKVNKETAELIRLRLKRCKSLLYAISPSSKLSSWVQWELGFADGHKNRRVAILPITDNDENSTDFYKQEYLGLYPYIDKTDTVIWANENGKWKNLKDWIKGEDIE